MATCSLKARAGGASRAQMGNWAQVDPILLSTRELHLQAGPSGLTSCPRQGHPALPSGRRPHPGLALPPQPPSTLAPGPPGQLSSGCAPATAHGCVGRVAVLLPPQPPPVDLWPWRDSRPPAGSGCDESGLSRAIPGAVSLLCPDPGGLTWALSPSRAKASARRIFSTSISWAMSCLAW